MCSSKVCQPTLDTSSLRVPPLAHVDDHNHDVLHLDLVGLLGLDIRLMVQRGTVPPTWKVRLSGDYSSAPPGKAGQ
jgi:hypothetical protein